MSLVRNEKNFGKVTSIVVTVLVCILAVLKIIHNSSEPVIQTIFDFEVLVFSVGQITMWRSINRQKTFFKVLGKIDEKFNNFLNKRKELMEGNVKTQRVFVIV